MSKITILNICLCLIISSKNSAQLQFYVPVNYDTVSWSFNDFGKMYTFDSVPTNTFEKNMASSQRMNG